MQLKSSTINSYGYVIDKSDMTGIQLENLRRELTVKPFKMETYAKFSKENDFEVFEESENQICIPKYFGIEKFGKPNKNILEKYTSRKYDMRYLGDLRDNQKIIVAKIMKGFEEHRGGILVAGCGCGKTNMAIWLACQLKVKTLFVVHKDFLKNQITKRIKSTTNIKKVGTIQGKKVDTDHAFVIGMVQSLTSKKTEYDRKIFKEFGLIIIDEVHHMGSKVYSSFFRKISSKYMLGISAENRRNDGMYKLINWYMGPILHFEEQKPNDKVLVKSIVFKSDNENRTEVIIDRRTKEPNRSLMITNLIHIKRRNQLLYNIIKILYRAGRTVLFLTGRRKHIKFIERCIKRDYEIAEDYGLYIGSMNEEELAISSKKKVILGTYDMAQEGLDIEDLDVLVMATPKSTVKQPIGRILRKDHAKNPLVIEINDEVSIFIKQAMKRSTYYQKQKYYSSRMKVSDYKCDGYVNYDNIRELEKFLHYVPDPEEKKICTINDVDDYDVEFADSD